MNTMNSLMQVLSRTDDLKKDVVFRTAESQIRPDYHLTEVRVAAFSSMDCGGEMDSWNEAQIQLLESSSDPTESSTYLSAEKIHAILSKANTILKPELDSRLTIELTTQDGVLGKWQIGHINTKGVSLEIALEPVSAVCKPAIKSMAERSDVGACCAPSVASPCCSTSSCC